MPAEMPPNLLVTGANGDIGRCLVKLALARGTRVFATIRSEAHIASFDQHERLSFFMMHVDDPASVSAAFAQLDEHLQGEPLAAVVHCAAVETPACVEFLDPRELETTLRINTIGALSVMQHAMPRLRHSGGNLVLASSLWGFASGPAVGPYAASKWALEALINAARCETAAMGFSISAANIGAVKSRMLDHHVDAVEALLENGSDDFRSLYGACLERHAKSSRKFHSLASKAENVAEQLFAIASAQRPKASYAIGADAKLLRILNWAMPRGVMDKILIG